MVAKVVIGIIRVMVMAKDMATVVMITMVAVAEAMIITAVVMDMAAATTIHPLDMEIMVNTIITIIIKTTIIIRVHIIRMCPTIHHTITKKI